MILKTEAALQKYRELRQEHGAGNSTPERQAHMPHVLQMFSSAYLWPFRVVVAYGDKEKPTFLLVLNHGGHGDDEMIWEMRGWHREQDMVKLAVKFRNIYYSGHVSQLEHGELDGGLRAALPKVERLMHEYTGEQ